MKITRRQLRRLILKETRLLSEATLTPGAMAKVKKMVADGSFPGYVDYDTVIQSSEDLGGEPGVNSKIQLGFETIDGVDYTVLTYGVNRQKTILGSMPIGTLVIGVPSRLPGGGKNPDWSPGSGEM